MIYLAAAVAYPTVNTHADLPAANSVAPPDNIYLVITSTGTWPFNRKERGLWYSDGATWTRLGDVTPIFVDDVFQIRDNTDPSKILQFNVDLLVGTGLKYFKSGTGTIAEISDIPTDYLSTNQSSLFFLTANSSLLLEVGYTSHTHSQYINTSNSSLFQSTGPYLTTQKEQDAAIISQTGTNAPTAIVEEDTIGILPGDYTRDNVGQYIITKPGIFIDGKTFLTFNSEVNTDDTKAIALKFPDNDYVYIITKSAGNVLTDSILAVFGKLHLEIRIYQ